MSKEPKEYLRHIQDECSYIISVSGNLSFKDFLEDETLKRAVVKLEVWKLLEKLQRRFLLTLK